MMWFINMEENSKADILDNLKRLSGAALAAPKKRQICTFCTGCKAQHGTMSLNPTHSHPQNMLDRGLLQSSYGDTAKSLHVIGFPEVRRIRVGRGCTWMCVCGCAVKCATQSVK